MIPIVFLIVGTGAIIVNVSEAPLDAFAFSVGKWYITGSREGVQQGTGLVRNCALRGILPVFLSLNTVMTDILGACRKLHLPSLLIELMLLIYRFIFVLSETAHSITISQQSRLGSRDMKTRIRSFGAMEQLCFFWR